MAKSFRKNDPFYKRESKNYENPVPSREYISEYLKKAKKPLTYKELVKDFGLNTTEEQEGLSRRLKAMCRDGQIMGNRRGGYALAEELELVAGYVVVQKDGYGFLIPDQGGPDIFLSAKQMQQVFSNDRVLVKSFVSRRGDRREGVIVEILERRTATVVGKLYEESSVFFVEPLSRDVNQTIIIPHEKRASAKIGEYVSVRILTQPSRRHQPVGEICEVLGDSLTSGLEIELAIRSHQIPHVFPQEVLQEAQHINKQKIEATTRYDARHIPFVTIDGSDARDFDDAVYCDKLSDGSWKLLVAIADVSHYVARNKALDVEAELRGTSVYYPNRVIPMLPEVLSNDLCSLKPKVDRLVVLCELFLDEKGYVLKKKFHDAIIHSHARLTYDEVSTFVADSKSRDNFSKTKHGKSVVALFQLTEHLLACRTERGTIDFDLTETQIIFNDDMKIDKIIPRDRNIAHRMIEESMLAANVAAAEFLREAKKKILYRIHETPSEEKIQALRDFLKSFGLSLAGGDKPQTKDYSKLLQQCQQRAEFNVIQTMMLRSLQQAIYTIENKGHFGLAFNDYCHFTSPIRRYPDLLIHRALKSCMHNDATLYDYRSSDLIRLGEQCSMTERRAERSSRDVESWLKCDYMLDKLGQEFNGIISTVTNFGLFVELDEIFVEGLVHITELKGDYYHFDNIHHVLTGKRSGKSYRIGDKIKVLLAKVDRDQRKIDFVLV